MPQISLYIDETTLKRVEDAAAAKHQSISRWVGELIRSQMDSEYPSGFSDLFGAVSEPLVRPDQGSFEADGTRESL